MAVTTNYTDIAYIEEVTVGTTPATPTFQLLPTTGGSPVANITTATSEVIRADRQTDDLVVVDADVTGDINYELSYEPYKDLLLALLQQDTVDSNITLAGVSGDAGADATILSATSIHSTVEIGDTFTLTGSATETNVNGLAYTVTDNTTTDEISISPSLDENFVSFADADLDITTRAKNGSDTPKSYTFRKTVDDGTSVYRWYYRGMRISSMNFNFATGSILNGSFSLKGLTEETRTTVLTGETADTAVQEYTIMNSVSSVGTIYLEGVTLGTCSFSSLDLTYDNQIESAKSIGTLGACDTASYSVMITGNVEVYFKDLSLYNKFKNAESFGVSIVLSDGDANAIGINMPKCKFESLDTPVSGKDAFLMQSGSFKALRDATEDYMFKLCLVDKQP